MLWCCMHLQRACLIHHEFDTAHLLLQLVDGPQAQQQQQQQRSIKEKMGRMRSHQLQTPARDDWGSNVQPDLDDEWKELLATKKADADPELADAWAKL